MSTDSPDDAAASDLVDPADQTDEVADEQSPARFGETEEIGETTEQGSDEDLEPDGDDA